MVRFLPHSHIETSYTKSYDQTVCIWPSAFGAKFELTLCEIPSEQLMLRVEPHHNGSLFGTSEPRVKGMAEINAKETLIFKQSL